MPFGGPSAWIRAQQIAFPSSTAPTGPRPSATRRSGRSALTVCTPGSPNRPARPASSFCPRLPTRRGAAWNRSGPSRRSNSSLPKARFSCRRVLMWPAGTCPCSVGSSTRHTPIASTRAATCWMSPERCMRVWPRCCRTDQPPTPCPGKARDWKTESMSPMVLSASRRNQSRTARRRARTVRRLEPDPGPIRTYGQVVSPRQGFTEGPGRSTHYRGDTCSRGGTHSTTVNF